MQKELKHIWKALVQTAKDFGALNIFRMSAALAYYTIFGLAPVLIIVLRFVSVFASKKPVGYIFLQIRKVVGDAVALQIQSIIQNVIAMQRDVLMQVIGIVALIISATGVFTEIQDSINTIWRVRAKPKHGWLKLLLNRLLSFSIVISLGFILLVSLLVNALLAALMSRLNQLFPESTVFTSYIVNIAITFLTTTTLFAIIFKVLPDARIKWQDVFVGAITTAILFMLGRFLIGYYLQKSTITNTFGAASSIIIILSWVYYSAIILYFGAAFTRANAQLKGREIEPNDYAVWIETVERKSKSVVNSN
ncbi:ribonuclease BN [Arachidicoccus ginsenosidimutans]|uniref:YihY/virulence factor BrkB family protein n=1 Tax=Arachidicoccus sp. BS20 TaxID=1850526 RepID=UPI0007F05A52|nr:YihY/virulence factor BrkB family protein [Arachidicoccus sp. BS20]ANI88386.1 ribonuclease BN [Arachidicoccus sp. BS20]